MNSPAERLIAAADLLEKRAGEATDGPWSTDGRYVWITGALDYGHVVDDDGMSMSDARYIATMHPGAGKLVADWLRSEAQATKGGEGRGFGGANLYRTNPRALELADLVLNGERP